MCVFLISCVQHEICSEKKCKDWVNQRKPTRGIDQGRSIQEFPLLKPWLQAPPQVERRQDYLGPLGGGLMLVSQNPMRLRWKQLTLDVRLFRGGRRDEGRKAKKWEEGKMRVWKV